MDPDVISDVGELSVDHTDTNRSAYNASYEDMEDYQAGADLNSHTAVVVIYRIIVPIICGCGILGIILTGM